MANVITFGTAIDRPRSYADGTTLAYREWTVSLNGNVIGRVEVKCAMDGGELDIWLKTNTLR